MMTPPRVTVVGLTSVLHVVRPGHAPECVAETPSTFASALDLGSESHEASASQRGTGGPGAALLAGILGRLGIDCQALLDVGDDDWGARLESDLAICGPHLRPLIRRVAGSQTTQACIDDVLAPLPRFLNLPDSPPATMPSRDEPRGAVGIWAGAEQAAPARHQHADSLPGILSSLDETGLLRVVSLLSPGLHLVEERAEHQWIRDVACHCDVLCCQADHLLQFIDPAAAESLSQARPLSQLHEWLSGLLLHEMARYLLSLGAGAVVIGLREHGIYFRSHSDGNRVSFARRFAPDDHVAAYLSEWIDREMLSPLFETPARNRIAFTEAAAAGFVAALLAGQSPGEMLRTMAGVVSVSSEQENPLEAIPPWQVIDSRIQAGWGQAHCHIDLSGWGDDGTPFP